MKDNKTCLHLSSANHFQQVTIKVIASSSNNSFTGEFFLVLFILCSLFHSNEYRSRETMKMSHEITPITRLMSYSRDKQWKGAAHTHKQAKKIWVGDAPENREEKQIKRVNKYSRVERTQEDLSTSRQHKKTSLLFFHEKQFKFLQWAFAHARRLLNENSTRFHGKRRKVETRSWMKKLTDETSGNRGVVFFKKTVHMWTQS